MKVLSYAIIVSFFSFSTDCTAIQEDGKTEGHGQHQTAKGEAQLFENMGPYRRQFKTDSVLAQKFLNQGMIWLQAFNHDEARRSFLKAAELDTKCAWAWWGVAYCEGPNYNDPKPDANRSQAAWYALQNALARIDNASELERDLINALKSRYSHPSPENRSKLEKAYAEAMGKVWEKHPQSADVGALYAESLMQLKPWQLYTKAREPVEGTMQIRSILEKVMELDPNHPGAKHLYIHAVEPSVRPHNALKAANELDNMVPASGHLLHMPSHIYIQTGHWQKAIEQNAKAVKSDKAYRKLSPNQTIQYLYQAHNAHMLAFAAMMTGQEKVAMNYAREIWNVVPKEEMSAKGPLIDFSFMCLYDVQKRFGRWDDILKEKAPPKELPLTTAYFHAHKSIAYAALQKFHLAEVEFANFLSAKAKIPEDSATEGTINHRILKVSEHFVQGEIAIHRKKWDTAVWHLKKAVAIEDTLRYTEPPYWLQPVRHTLGAVYMKMGEFKKAEQTYREDLKVWADNGWSLYGLRESLLAQERADEANSLLTKLDKVWSKADEKEITTSCKCIENLAKEGTDKK